MTRERVLLTGASGSMGFVAFEELWKRRDRFDIVRFGSTYTPEEDIPG